MTEGLDLRFWGLSLSLGWEGGGKSPPLLTHIVSFEVPIVVTGLWKPKRKRGESCWIHLKPKGPQPAR